MQYRPVSLVCLLALVAAGVPLFHSISGETDPAIPTGSLSATPKSVQPGTFPLLTWDITYPEKVTDVVDIEPPGKITPNEDLYMDVRVLGASFQSSPGNWKPIQAWVKPDGSSSWSDFFYDAQPDVDPTRIYYSKLVRAGRPNYFGGRYNWNGWGNFHNTTQTSSKNVIALVNGDDPPSYAPAFDQGDVESFLDPYIDANGKIDIGPMDVIFLYELYSTNPGSSYFDMQDLVLLVTFRRLES